MTGLPRIVAAVLAETAVRLRPWLVGAIWAAALLAASWSTAAPVLHLLGTA